MASYMTIYDTACQYILYNALQYSIEFISVQVGMLFNFIQFILAQSLLSLLRSLE